MCKLLLQQEKLKALGELKWKRMFFTNMAKCKIKQDHRLCALVSREHIATQAVSTKTR